MSLFNPPFDPEPYTYLGERLREVAFPLGGIGTGCVSLDGRGGLRDWEIFNRPNKGSLLETTFPALWAKPEGSEAKALVVQGPRVKNWMGEGSGTYNYGHGQFFKQMDGLPCFDEIRFKGTFPFARVEFEKAGFPLEVELCAFNPFIPLDLDSSSFPAACLVYRLKNRTDRVVEATLAWSMMNPVGESKPDESGESDRALQEPTESQTCRGIKFANARFHPDEAHFGTAALSTNWSRTAILPKWETGSWFDAVQAFWNSFRSDGALPNPGNEPTGQRASGTVAASVTLAPGEEVEIPFLISWVFPVATKYWAGGGEPESPPWKPYYATRWPDAWAVAQAFFERFEELSGRTLKFERALFQSTLPPEVIESVSATASILHSPTVLRLEDGTFWAWEGCSSNEGCCAGTCSHVWNYALAQAYLFPEMQWNMRRADYRYNFNCGPQGKDGAMLFRLMIPLGAQADLWHAASDGQLGGIVQLFRDWKLSGRRDLLEELWPNAKLALGYACRAWDRDGDGLVDGDMHNTYDINFQGPNPLTQFFFLAALRAAEEIAKVLGDADTAAACRRLFESGRARTEEVLWNGEFFVQSHEFTGAEAPKYQHGKGCLSDQVFGQLAATLSGLGDLVDPAMVQSALAAIYRYNYREPLGDHENLQRVYAVADEPGLLLCSWPNGGRPLFPFIYSDEVWTGIEYQVATHLALVGMKNEALSIVRAVRKRYDGTRRNPYNEFECGSHYARALAAYGLLIAFSGFRYDGVTHAASIDGTGDFKAFFCVPEGWGIASAEKGGTRLDFIETGRLGGIPV